MYTKDKFVFTDEQYLDDPSVLQRIYALEWFDIPRCDYLDLVQFHPYLTVGDDTKLFYINVQHKVELATSFALFSFAFSRILLKRGPVSTSGKFIRLPISWAFGGLAAYQMN